MLRRCLLERPQPVCGGRRATDGLNWKWTSGPSPNIEFRAIAAAWRQLVCPRLSGQRGSLGAAAWISGQLAHLWRPHSTPDVGRAQNHFDRLPRVRRVRQTGGRALQLRTTASGSGSGRGGLAAREDHPGRPRRRWPGRRQLRSEAPGTRGRRLLDERVLRRRPWTSSSRAYRAVREQTPQISRPAFLGEPGAVRVAVGLSARPNAGRPDRGTESPLQPVPWSDYRQQLQATAKRGTCLRPNDLSILG